MFIDITAKDWAFAALLGQARRKSNESTRKTSRDRGSANNVHVDLMGSISEIIAYKHFKPILTDRERAKILKGMFRLSGGGGKLGADLFVSQLQKTLDVKGFDCADNKRFFAINQSKHADLAGACDGYLCVVCPKYSKRAFVIDHVPYEDVSCWESKTLGSYGDPSFNLSIVRFMAEYSQGVSLAAIRESELFSREIIDQEIKRENTRNVFYTYFPDAKGLLERSGAAA
jgi:hypothetical protein